MNGIIRNPVAASGSSRFSLDGVYFDLLDFLSQESIVTSWFYTVETIMSIKIGELAKRTESTVETIRYYEKEGLLTEPYRSDGNYRLYGEEHIERLQFIRHCRTLDMALDEVRTLLKHRDFPNEDCGDVNALLDDHIRAVEVRVEELDRFAPEVREYGFGCHMRNSARP